MHLNSIIMGKKNKKNYGLYKFAIVLLLISSVVIYHLTEDYWKVLMFLPLLAIIFLGFLMDKIEKSEEKRKSMGIRQYYEYPQK